MTELCEIGLRFHTDKVIAGYTEFYHTLFETRRGIKKVLEIGIGSLEAMKHVADYVPGASLFMWQEYFPQATIYGLDINPAVLVNEGRIQSRKCDQRNSGELVAAAEWAGGEFDLIVDDGDHTGEYQWVAFNALIPFVKPGGFYIIEDATDSIWLSDKLTEYTHQHSVVSTVNGKLIGKLIMVRV